jgi:uncharacterized membrane protein
VAETSGFWRGYTEQGPAVRVGLGLAVASIAPSLARGLMDRSAADQAVISGILGSVRMGIGAFGHALSTTAAEIVAERRGGESPERTQLAGAVTLAAVAGASSMALPSTNDTPLPLLVGRVAALEVARGATATATVIAVDAVASRLFHDREDVVQMGLAAAVGGVSTGVRIARRRRRAGRYYEAEERPRGVIAAVMADGRARRPAEIAKASAAGAAAAVGVVGLAATELTIAQAVIRAAALPGREQSLALPVLAHGTSLAVLAAASAVAVDQVRRRVEHHGDIVEAAYRQPPESDRVSAGPASAVRFEDIGKEGRRFVVMALDAEEISSVMEEPAIDPVRVVVGYRSSRSVAERAAIAIQELDLLGGFDRSVIMVGAPTGVGYLNYVVAEALEYLTRGDCATVVPQYSHSPSALSLDRVGDGVQLQTLVLRGIANRVRRMPTHRRPRVVQFGESLGAMVAMDVGANLGAQMFNDLDIDAGLYLGVPFLSRSWQRWQHAPAFFDPRAQLHVRTSGTDPVQPLPPFSHLMVIHDDDPVNKFAFDMVVRPPTWMGPPDDRPPGVPRETKFRPLTTFLITLVDLKNGMQSRPGEFRRVGHDYRIDVRASMQEAFRLSATETQAERIEEALREREQAWSMSRLVADAFSAARNQTAAKLKSWGVPIDEGLFARTADDLARGQHLARRQADDEASQHEAR